MILRQTFSTTRQLRLYCGEHFHLMPPIWNIAFPGDEYTNAANPSTATFHEVTRLPASLAIWHSAKPENRLRNQAILDLRGGGAVHRPIAAVSSR